MAKFTEVRKPYSSFLVGLCTVVGGVYTVAGLVDASLHRLVGKHD